MAFSSSNYNDNQPSISRSFFGKTMRIEGVISSEEDLTIEGTVTGELKVSKTLTIGNNGHINGKISAAVVRISGGAEGELIANQKLEIASSGKYNGHITADTIMVAEGAILKGTINCEDEIEPEEKEDVAPQDKNTPENNPDAPDNQEDIIDAEEIKEETEKPAETAEKKEDHPKPTASDKKSEKRNKY